MELAPGTSLDHLFTAAFANAFHKSPLMFSYAIAFVVAAVLLNGFMTAWRRERGTGRLRRRPSNRITSAPPPREFHLFVRAQAAHALSRFLSKKPREHPDQAFAYLRSVPAFVFEEMILISLAKRKLKVRHNSRYTGDGGVDGRFWIGDELWLVQAKRYLGQINADDVWYFNSVCERENAYGIFVHTGRTSPAAKTRIQQSDRVVLISGDGPLAFFLLDALQLAPGRRARPSVSGSQAPALGPDDVPHLVMVTTPPP